MQFLDLASIKQLILTVKETNVLDDFSKNFLEKANDDFTKNCLNGHLTVAKWLYSRENIDINAKNKAFELSCQNGHFAIAQWLYSLGNVDIHINREGAFYWSCYVI